MLDVVYELLALIDDSPAREIRYSNIPTHLHNALNIARGEGWIDSSSDPKLLADLPPEDRNPKTRNPAYWLTSKGRGELAKWRESKNTPLPFETEPLLTANPADSVDQLFTELWDRFAGERAEARRRNRESDVATIELVSNVVLQVKCAMQNVHRILRGSLSPYDQSRSHRLSGNAKTVDATWQTARGLVTDANLDLFAIHSEPVCFRSRSSRCYASLIWELFQAHHNILLKHATCYPVTPTFEETRTGTAMEHYLHANFQTEILYDPDGITAVCAELQTLLGELGFENETQSFEPLPTVEPAIPETEESELPEPVAQTASGSVLLFGRGDQPIVNGKKKPTLTDARYNVVFTLLNVGDDGLTKDELDGKSGHPDARKLLKAVAEIDLDWEAVISFPGSAGKRYRIR